MAVEGYYDPVLVVLSIAVAIFASFTALNLAGRLLVAERSTRLWWLVAGAVAIGGGTWSMHFVGMLAFVMPMPVTYDIQLTLLSLLLPVLVVAAGLYILSCYGNGRRPLVVAGVMWGISIASMHYTGMAAMQMPGVRVDYDIWLVLASVAIAIVTATAAAWLAFRTTATIERLAASFVMGLAISGMHYTGMAAANFTMSEHAAISGRPEINPGLLAIVLVITFTMLLLLGLVTAFFDRKLATLTAREAAALARSEERHRALIRNASDVVAILDRGAMFVYEGSSAQHVLGYRTDELIGRSLLDLVQAEQASEVGRFFGSLLEKPGATATRELKVRHANGTWHDFEVVGKNLLHEPSIEGMVVNLRDVSERKRLMRELEKLSETDALTDTLNRRGFLKRAEREVGRAGRTGHALTVAMIDIDHFKEVNDVYGHAAGDMVLSMVADCCRQGIRTGDVVARMGGEEFVVLLTDTNIREAHEVVTRLREDIAASRVTTIRGEVSVTASFGLAAANPDADDIEAAIRLADEALYQAKDAGRNCIKISA